MRILSLPALLLLLLTGACTATSQELLPIPASIKGASMIASVEVVIQPAARRSVAAIDGTTAAPAAPPQVPFTKLLERSILDAAREAGLGSGRALALRIEVDAVQTAAAAQALLGRNDRLQGLVFVRDAQNGEELGQLYIDIDRSNGGLMSAVTRLGSVRESLARQFGREVAKALGGGLR